MAFPTVTVDRVAFVSVVNALIRAARCCSDSEGKRVVLPANAMKAAKLLKGVLEELSCTKIVVEEWETLSGVLRQPHPASTPIGSDGEDGA